MASVSFDIQDEADVNQFEAALEKYAGSTAGFFAKHLRLSALFRRLKKTPSDSAHRIFAAILDIQINFAYLWVESTISAGHNNDVNRKFASRKNQGSVLDLDQAFSALIRIHHSDTSFCLRYRAIWDKLMGICFLFFKPDGYEKFVGSKSRLKEFTKELAENPNVKKLLNSSFVGTSVADFLGNFENNFRTPEIHGSGRLRKFAFNVDPEQRMILGTNYWNGLNQAIFELGKLLESPQLDKILETHVTGDYPASPMKNP